MGDCADDFNALREYHRQRKRDVYETNFQYMQGTGLPFTIDNSGSLKFSTAQGTVMFYPSTNKFMHRGKVRHGNARAAEKYVRRLTCPHAN